MVAIPGGRTKALTVLFTFAAAIGVVEACGQGSGSAALPVAGSGTVLASADTCPTVGQPAPPSNLVGGTPAALIGYAEDSLRFVNDPHLSSQTVLLTAANPGTSRAVGVARIQPERCAHRLTQAQLTTGRIIARINSTAAHTGRALALVQGIQYVWVDDVTTTHPRMRILHVSPDGSGGIQVVGTFKFTPRPYPHLLGAPASTLYYDPQYELVQNTSCGDQCCGGGDDDRDRDSTGRAHDMMRDLLDASKVRVYPNRMAHQGVPQ